MIISHHRKRDTYIEEDWEMSEEDEDEFYNKAEPNVEPAVANEAALVMSGIASERNDSCGLSTVLDALAIREMVKEHRHG